jgi:O-antigen/teichoic acid export membrane protein
LGQDNATSILYFSDKDEHSRRKILRHGLLIQLCFFAMLAVLFLPVRNFVASLLFPNENTIAAFWLKALLIIPGHIVLNYVLNIFLWSENRKNYVILCFTQVCLGITGILLAMFFHSGIEGIFWSLILATTITGLVGFAMANRIVALKFQFDKSLIKKLVLMGAPFALTSFFQQLVPSIDRYFLLQFNYGNDLAQYALAVKIGGLLSIATSAFVLAFTPYSMNRIFEKNGEEQLSTLFLFVAPAMLLCIPIIILFKDVLVNLFADPSYDVSGKLLPLFFLGWAFDLFFYFSILGVYKSQKSYWMLFIFIAGIILISSLNFILVPRYGVFGAAAAFCITKAFLFFLPLIALRKFFKLSLNAVNFFGFLAASVLCSYLIYRLEFYQSLLLVAALITGSLFYLNSILQRHRLAL